MKKRSTSYTFDASAKTVVCTDFTSLEAIQLITNVTDNVIIYNFADPTKGGTLASTTLTLDFDTTSMDDADKLMILVDDGATTVTVTGPLTDTQLRASAVPVSLASVPSHAVTNAGTFAVQATGTVTANAGTNLNTSALALETGGNLAAIKAKTDNIPAQGQALAAASLPVVLPAAQITTLTPPAAITGFATSAKQDTLLAELQAKADLTETQPVSLASVPTHAVSQSGTWTVQPGNTANTTAWKVDGSAVTQPVSGTVSVTGVATAAKQDTIIGHVDGIETLLTTIEANQQSDGLTDTQLRATPVPVSGTVTANLSTLNGAATAAKQDDIITAIGAIPGGGGVQYTDGDADATPTGTVAMFDDAGVMTAVSDTNPMPVLTDALTDAQLRATAVDVAVTTMPITDVTQSGSWTVVANAGTDLNTSALAVETGGNLADIKTNTDNIPALGQALEAASVPVVLPAAQLSTLTPPAAITGFATSAKQDTIIGHVDGLETSAATIAGAVSGTEMQVDVLTMPTTTVQATNLDVRDLSSASDSVAAVQSGTWTVQPGNTANTTAWKVDGSAVTQPVSGTVTANLSATDNAVLDSIDTSTASKYITGIGHGVKTVTTAGTDVALASSTPCKKVTIQAQTDNTSLIAVGGTGVDATITTGTGIILYPGDIFEMDIDNLADVFIDSLVNGEGVRFTYFT